MPKVPVYNMAGEQIDEIELKEEIFNARVNPALLHQAVVMYEANRRAGTAATKTRAMVSGGGRKPWRQKGLGRARHGSIRSPIWRKGGVVFGPVPRDYRQKMPKKMRRAALRSALSAKVRDGELVVVDQLTLDSPKTREVVSLLRNLRLENAKPLIVLAEADDNVRLAARNVPGVKTIEARELNTYDVLKHPRVLFTREAVARVEEALAV